MKGDSIRNLKDQVIIDYTKSQLSPIFSENYKSHLKENNISRLADSDEILSGSYEILEELGASTFEEFKGLESRVKLDLWDFEDYLINSLNNYVDKNDYGNLTELFHPTDFVKIYSVNQVHTKRDRKLIAEKIYSYFHSIGFNFLFYNYVAKTIIIPKTDFLNPSFELAYRWAIIAILQVATAQNDVGIEEASRSFSLAIAYSDSWKFIAERLEDIGSYIDLDTIKRPKKHTRSNDFSDIAREGILKYQNESRAELEDINPRHVLNYIRNKPFIIWGETIKVHDDKTVSFVDSSKPNDLFLRIVKRQLDKLKA